MTTPSIRIPDGGPPVLQPDSPRPGYLPATPATVLWGELPCGTDRAVVEVNRGEELVIDTVSHEGILEDQGRDPLAYFAGLGVPAERVLTDAVEIAAMVPHDPATQGPHVVTGPVHVRGARPGDVLAITVLDLALRCDYGLVSNRHGRGALPEELPAGGEDVVSVPCWTGPGGSGDATTTAYGHMAASARSEATVRFPLRPFLGTMGVATAGSERAHSVPPGPHGGNLDISLLTAGSTLYLPVQVPGALAYVGDPHFAQGDGEVALTAFEAPLRARLRFEVIPAESLPHPPMIWAETPELLVPVGLDADLDEAMRACVRSALTLLTGRGMDTAHAYAYLSAAGDFAVSQVVDRVCGVHGKIRKADLAEL
ncbi:acetamidase/formamidase family protein [Ruania alkalisoli]|uniref:Acetamidase/formamidase family protein n=1 Tax=Ruania alkalisoli TaxID=2779775 RepID=A0A7M1SUL2_9MICO|nr:acetamidase/formamidase family protein [Ruania alkalisoli]QOR71248.1 acetamidase/formamidase family protein [Ruania alkalisoli]